MLVTGNFKIAFDSIRASKLRSFLTMLGIIIGVVSVVTVVSIGEGVKKQLTDQTKHMGEDVLTVRPGKPVTKDSDGNVTGVNIMAAFAGTSLPESDLKTIEETDGVHKAVPLSYVVAAPKVKETTYANSFVLGTITDLPELLNQKVEYGGFFAASDSDKNVAVIGSNLSEKLFKESVPVGSSVNIRGENFIVYGVLEKIESTAFVPNTDYNNAIFIPMDAARRISGGQITIQQVLVKPSSDISPAIVADNLTTRLLNAHAGQDDFVVLQQKDTLVVADTMLTLLTMVIGAIAAVSLIVGGIGIMNVMLVSVTERLHEIGVRKAVGATNHQIMMQFIIESGVISFVGGVVGVMVSLVVNGLLRITTDLQPVITLPVMGASVLIAVLVGTLFGIAPAWKAARKDPIEALRRV